MLPTAAPSCGDSGGPIAGLVLRFPHALPPQGAGRQGSHPHPPRQGRPLDLPCADRATWSPAQTSSRHPSSPAPIRLSPARPCPAG